MRSTNRHSFIRSLKRKGFQEEIVIKIGLYDLVTSTTLESNKSLTEKQNLAPRIAGLVLQTVTHNTRRYDTLQRFMRTTDSVTVAIEVPVSLTPEDIIHIQQSDTRDCPPLLPR